jgi:hypothetical protein
MKRSALATFAMLLIPALLDAGNPPRSSVLSLFVRTTFRRLDRFEQLPEPVRNNLLSHFGKGEPGLERTIANPGQPFNAGDAVDMRYPMRRLVFAGAGDGIWFAYYEHGGLAFHEHLVIYQRGSAEPVFAGTFIPSHGGHYREPPSTIDELKQWLAAGDITGNAAPSRDW